MRTTQNEFHSMRGHVADGCEVVMDDGRVFTVKSVISGWVLRNEAGMVVFGPTQSAADIDRAVFCYVPRTPAFEYYQAMTRAFDFGKPPSEAQCERLQALIIGLQQFPLNMWVLSRPTATSPGDTVVGMIVQLQDRLERHRRALRIAA